MATITRKRTVALPDDTNDDIEDAQSRALVNSQIEDDPEQTEVDRVTSLLQLASNAGKASVKIYRLDNGKSVFCDSYSPQEFEDGDFKMIRDSFGPGVYKIMLYGEHPATGKFGLLTRTEITLAENRNPTKLQSGAPQNSELVQVLASIAEGQRQLMQAIADNRPAPIDPMVQMQSMLQTMALMKSAMGLDNAQQSQKSSISEIIEAVRELKAVAGEIAPNENDGSSLVGMLPQVLEVIKTATAQRAEQHAPQPLQMPIQRIQMQPQPQAPNPAPVNQPAAPSQQTQDDENMRVNQILELKTYMSQLLQMAKSNAPIDSGIDLVFEKLPDEFFAMLAMDNWFDGLKAFESGVEPYREWFQSVRDGSLAEYAAQTDDIQDAVNAQQSNPVPDAAATAKTDATAL